MLPEPPQLSLLLVVTNQRDQTLSRAGSSMAHEPLCYSDHSMGLRKGEQPAPFTLAQGSFSLLTTPSTQQHFLTELRLCCGFLPFELVLEISGKTLCPVFHSRSRVLLPLGVHAACEAQS